MQLRRLCNRGHQGLWCSHTEEMMGIQHVQCLTATGFVKANVAKAHPQARKGCCTEKFFSISHKEQKWPFLLLPSHYMDILQNKQTKTQKNKQKNTKQTTKTYKTNPNLTTGHPRPHGKTYLHHLSSQEQIF